MSDIQNLIAIFRSPEAAALVAPAVQASDLATRQGLASIQRDVARREDQVQASENLAPGASVDGRREEAERRARARQARAAQAEAASGKTAPYPKRRLDIIA